MYFTDTAVIRALEAFVEWDRALYEQVMEDFDRLLAGHGESIARDLRWFVPLNRLYQRYMQKHERARSAAGRVLRSLGLRSVAGAR